MFGTWVYYHGTMSHTFMSLTFDLNIKIIFSPWIWVWQNVFALLHRHTKFWHMGVSPWDNMLCTFLTLVWPWSLIYMRVAGGILSEFYSQFLSCWIRNKNSRKTTTYKVLFSKSVLHRLKKLIRVAFSSSNIVEIWVHWMCMAVERKYEYHLYPIRGRRHRGSTSIGQVKYFYH